MKYQVSLHLHLYFSTAVVLGVNSSYKSFQFLDSSEHSSYTSIQLLKHNNTTEIDSTHRSANYVINISQRHSSVDLDLDLVVHIVRLAISSATFDRRYQSSQSNIPLGQKLVVAKTVFITPLAYGQNISQANYCQLRLSQN